MVTDKTAITQITSVPIILVATTRSETLGPTIALIRHKTATLRTADVIGTYVYREGLGGGKFSYTTAVNLFMHVIGLLLTYIANRVSNALTGSGLW